MLFVLAMLVDRLFFDGQLWTRISTVNPDEMRHKLQSAEEAGGQLDLAACRLCVHGIRLPCSIRAPCSPWCSVPGHLTHPVHGMRRALCSRAPYSVL